MSEEIKPYQISYVADKPSDNDLYFNTIQQAIHTYASR